MGKKEKKPFKMPHLLWIMFGIIVLACLATYLIPAGEFAVNEAGQITGTDFHFLGHQTPVSPWGALMRVKSGTDWIQLQLFREHNTNRYYSDQGICSTKST